MVLNKLKKIRHKLARGFVYATRTQQWLGLFNSVILIFITFTNLKLLGVVDISLYVLAPVAILSVVILFVVAGFIEAKFGMFREVQRVTMSYNPHIQEIKDSLKRVEDAIRR